MTSNRFLVVVRAGDSSLHPGWTTSLEDRDWDLVVSYFGSNPTRFRDAAEQRRDDTGPKWPGLHALLTRDPFWRSYDYVWLPDDDLATTQATVSAFFAACARNSLDLAQPSLSWSSYISYPVTLRHPRFNLRRTTFVEGMAPCFRRPFLESCLATFGTSQSGWGLPRVWARMRPGEPPRMGIVDEVAVTHTRPVGGPNYDALRVAGISPQAEKIALLRRYGIPVEGSPRLEGAVGRDGKVMAADDPALMALLRADMADIREHMTLQKRIEAGRALSTTRR